MPEVRTVYHSARNALSISNAEFSLCTISKLILIFAPVTPEMFKEEIEEALRVYDRHIVCLEKTPEECRRALVSLVKKAIETYKNRQPGFRHGIALDKHITVILSQSDSDRPLCGIYFNLHSPYRKKMQDQAQPRS